jgi:hypothetical protein
VPARGLERLAGGLPVLSQERRPLVDPIRVVLGNRLGDRGVNRGAVLAELRPVSDLPGQRVLKA